MHYGLLCPLFHNTLHSDVWFKCFIFASTDVHASEFTSSSANSFPAIPLCLASLQTDRLFNRSMYRWTSCGLIS